MIILNQVPRPAQRGLHAPVVDPATPHDEPGDLNVDATVLQQAAADLARRRLEMNVPLTPAETSQAEQRASAVVDPNTKVAAAEMRPAYAQAPTVHAESGVTPAMLNERGDQLDAALMLYQSAADTEQDVEDSRRIVAQVQRDVVAEMRAEANRMLSDKSLPDADRRELQAMVVAADREEQGVLAAKAARGQQTHAQNTQRAAEMADQQQHESALQTFIKVRRGGDATPDEINAAYDALIGDRRDQSR